MFVGAYCMLDSRAHFPRKFYLKFLKALRLTYGSVNILWQTDVQVIEI